MPFDILKSARACLTLQNQLVVTTNSHRSGITAVQALVRIRQLFIVAHAFSSATFSSAGRISISKVVWEKCAWLMTTSSQPPKWRAFLTSLRRHWAFKPMTNSLRSNV